MKKIRMKILAHGLLVLGLSVSVLSTANAQTKASVTKVGNGDDGADLEDLSPLTSGPIVEARNHALKLLDKLNVVGVPGLGMLTPELEKTDLLIAAKDVHPTGEQKGSLEISEDQSFVYARTFATPSAATRFFPAAKKLNSDQLVALHIHEALHRALPASIRENENIVMHFTLAITSPGANFDRVHQVSDMYLKPNGQVADSNKSKSAELQVILPESSKTEFKYQFDSFSSDKDGLSDTPYIVHGLELSTSLGGYNSFMGRAVEPVLRARLKISQGTQEIKNMSPLSIDLEARVATQTGVAGPFIRFTTPLEDSNDSNFPMDERDVVTLGGFYRAQYESSYFNGTVEYVLPSRGRVSYLNDSVMYRSIISLNSQFGFKWKDAKFGAIAEFHASKGKDVASAFDTDPFNLIILGPEISYSIQNLEFKTYFKKVVNQNQNTMDDLGDVMDHGYGLGAFGASLSYGW